MILISGKMYFSHTAIYLSLLFPFSKLLIQPQCFLIAFECGLILMAAELHIRRRTQNISYFHLGLWLLTTGCLKILLEFRPFVGEIYLSIDLQCLLITCTG